MHPLTDLLLANFVVGLGATVQAYSGIGLGLVAGPLLALLDPDLIPGPLLIAALLLSVGIARRFPAAIDRRGVRSAILWRLPGAALGVWLLRLLSPDELAILVAGLALAALTIRFAAPSRLREPSRPAVALFAGLSGFMGTTAAMGGPPMALLYSAGRVDRMRSSLAAYFTFGAALSLIQQVAGGVLTSSHLVTGLALLPGVVVGLSLARLLDRLSLGETVIRWLAISVSIAGPVALIAHLFGAF